MSDGERTQALPVDVLPVDVERLARAPQLERLSAALVPGRRVLAGGLWGSSQALILAGLARRAPGPWVALASTDAEARLFADDLAAFGLEPTWLPARESFAGQRARVDAENVRRRIRVARALAGTPAGRPRLVVGSLLALLQPVPDARAAEAGSLALETGQRIDLEHVLKRLVGAGYARQPLVERPGEVSLRGDILDLFPFSCELPLRVELLDDEVESLRTFDPADQRSIEASERVELYLAGDPGGVEEGVGLHPAQLLSPTATLVEVEPLRVEDVAQGLRLQSAAHERALKVLREATAERRHLALQSLPGGAVDFDTRSVQALAVGMRAAPEALRAAGAGGARVVVLCQTAAELHRLVELVEAQGGVEGLDTCVGGLARGFRLPALGIVLVNHRELVGVAGRRHVRRERQAHHARIIQSFFELKVGDLVVHAVHGLARYEGLVRMQRGEGREDHLHLVFADDVSVFVPAARIDVVQRYIGSGAAAPALDRVGGQSFRKRKERVQRALFDLASELLEVHARRALKRRDPWPPDDELVREMVGEFPWVDTPDQARTDEEVARDLCAPSPMDRLICGDVGFGKTELAVRAAFRVVNGGAQVAVLVPTTVLAQQHFETFSERLADFPVQVELLSRYVTPARTQDVIERTRSGHVDVLIGTHRILSKDVEFARLGLVVVDEEQRFGVMHKEHFKRLRAQVDLLTLTATPIPRTLHMSLSGVRDISALTIPPEGRQEIETALGRVADEALIREAIRREKNRGGQVFYLHNRVSSIEQVAARLSALVPECSYAIGHGQMSARELQHVMDLFTHGEVDVLVATTIIESGLDIPAAGTIIVHDADQFGLSELHQLRGRVGRGENRAFCYLLVDEHKPMREVARDRLKALEEMNQLGAGFAISMKDLEIRGAGNVLGPEQSGHIAAVGYDLYCRLLKQTIERLRAGVSLRELEGEELLDPGVELELGLDAYLPEKWLPAADARLDLLRELTRIDSDAAREEAEEMLRDRFGRVPPEVLNLLRTFRLKPALEELGLRRLAWQREAFLIEYDDRVALEHWLAPLDVELRPIRTGLAHLRIPRERATPERALEWLEGLLKLPARRRRMARARSPRDP